MQKWLLWTEHQYRLPPVGKAFQELGGKELCAMSEEQFRQRSPLGGEVLHAHLDIWKSGGTWCGQRQPLGLQARDPDGDSPARMPAGRLLLLGSALNPAPSAAASPEPRASRPWPSPETWTEHVGS